MSRSTWVRSVSAWNILLFQKYSVWPELKHHPPFLVICEVGVLSSHSIVSVRLTRGTGVVWGGRSVTKRGSAGYVKRGNDSAASTTTADRHTAPQTGGGKGTLRIKPWNTVEWWRMKQQPRHRAIILLMLKSEASSAEHKLGTDSRADWKWCGNWKTSSNTEKPTRQPWQQL